MKIAAFLPAKGSSTRIPNKNLSLLDGKPLFLHTLEKLMLCDFIDEVFLDTESEEVIEAASEVSCKLLRRDPLLASNSTDGNTLFMNQIKNTEADICIQILGTSPFININTIKKGIDILTSNDSIHDSVVLVRSEKKYIWEDGVPKYNINSIPNSIDISPTVAETMGLYIVKRKAALETQRRIGKQPFLLEASAMEAVDVNFPEDFELANLIASGLREKDRKLFLNLRNHLTSSLLSDILDDLGYAMQIIKGYVPNIATTKFLGRAKTLKLRKLLPNEDFRGIYNALKSYATIIPNDIIMVENEAPDYAYFGELNANLAIRSGASAVVVGGKTRDSAEVLKIGFPVFSSGFTCQDVRKRATLDSFNKKIQINGVEITPGDLIFGDSEGIVVIPRRIETIVVSEVFARISQEKKILIDISFGTDVEKLVTDYGFF